MPKPEGRWRTPRRCSHFSQSCQVPKRFSTSAWLPQRIAYLLEKNRAQGVDSDEAKERENQEFLEHWSGWQRHPNPSFVVEFQRHTISTWPLPTTLATRLTRANSQMSAGKSLIMCYFRLCATRPGESG